MSEENKDRLEEFFKKNTERYHFEYNEADWKKLEAQLDEAEKGGALPPGKRNGLKYYLTVGLLLLIAAGTYLGLNTLSTGSDNSDVSPATAPVSEQRTQKESLQSSESDRMLSANEVQKEERKAFSGFNKDSQSPLQTTGSAPVHDTQASALESKDIGGVMPDSGGSFSPISTEQNELSEVAFGSDDAAGEGRFMGVADYMLPFGISGHNLKNDRLLTIPLNDSPDTSAESDLIENEKEVPKRVFSAGFLFAPDFSTIGLGDYTRPGTRYGLRFEYNVSERFTMLAGVLMVNNVYKASAAEYNVPDEYWQGGELPDFGSGECKIVDIPVSLRYNITRSAKGRFFVSGGATSYIMLNEEYEFTYTGSGGYGGNSTTTSWKSDETTQHLFGLINLSAGYERFVATNWSVQAEPFINVPVSGIGWGKVDLYSMGMYLSLKYHWIK